MRYTQYIGRCVYKIMRHRLLMYQCNITFSMYTVMASNLTITRQMICLCNTSSLQIHYFIGEQRLDLFTYCYVDSQSQGIAVIYFIQLHLKAYHNGTWFIKNVAVCGRSICHTLIESMKTTFMENFSTGVLDRRSRYKSYGVLRHMKLHM